MKNNVSFISCALLLSTLAVLPGCAPLDWLQNTLGLKKGGSSSSESVGTGEVLVWADGKPLLSESEFKKQYNNFVEKHPLGSLLKQQEGFEQQMLNGLVAQRLISKTIHEQGFDQSPEYQEDLDQLKAMLDARYFEMKNQVTLSDAEIKAFYDEKKDAIPAAVVSRGGVSAMGVEFDKEADAKAFLEKVRGKGAEINQLAKDAKLDSKFHDFKLVNGQSVGIDASLRDKILAISKFPAYEVVKADGKYWVVFAAAKEQAKYRPFDQVKAAVQEMATMERQRDSFEKAVDELKKQYQVTINDAYFAKKKGSEVAEAFLDAAAQEVAPSKTT